MDYIEYWFRDKTHPILNQLRTQLSETDVRDLAILTMPELPGFEQRLEEAYLKIIDQKDYTKI